MDGHHLILGKLEDFFTGEVLDDTHDERYRQKLGRLLVEEKGYAKSDITPRNSLTVTANDNKAIVPVDYKINLADRVCMIVKYGPGSLVTRHRPALAASRLLAPYQIPVVVVTNGVDADVLNGENGRVVSSGLASIPSRASLADRAARFRIQPISTKQAEMESRIIYCYEIDGSCPCDDTVCRL